MRAAAAVRPPLSGVVIVAAALWLAVASCSAPGAQHPSAHRPASPRPKPTASVMIPTTPIPRELDQTGAPPAPDVSGDGTAPAPTHLSIPAIKVDTSVTRLGLNPDDTVEVPSDPGQAGWYTNGPAPGELGPAVILGHLDSVTGPAVFYHLASLRPGARILVGREDGSTATFVVQRVASFPVASFPTDQVYGATADPELRLITCGGQYSIVQRHYLENVVVFAVLAN